MQIYKELDRTILSELKQIRYNEIDAKTGGLIYAGFTYDSKSFSMSDRAQINWKDLDDVSNHVWPMDITTLENDQYSLAEANANAFVNAARQHKVNHLKSGSDLKKLVFDAVDEAAVLAVIDNR